MLSPDAEEKLSLGEAHADSGYVAVNEPGAPYTPDTLTRTWHKLTTAAGVASDPPARRPPLVWHRGTCEARR